MQELAARVLQHLALDAEQSRPNRYVAAQMGQLLGLLLSMHKSGRPGATWGCFANTAVVGNLHQGVADELKSEKNFFEVGRLLKDSDTSSVKNNTANFLANICEMGVWFLQITK